ncbi:putative reverse transcriptase domain-containing protein, partial [Tanacetum coccineum]
VADALSRKERIKPRRVRAMNMTIQSSIKSMILAAQNGASEVANAPAEMLRGLGMKKDIALYVSKCLSCLKVKAKHQRPSSLLQEPEILEWKWERIAMDFIMKLPITSSGHDSIWIIVDRLTKFAHFLHIREDFKIDRLAILYLNEIVARNGVPISIISDRDGRFTLQFWQLMQDALGTHLDMSTAYIMILEMMVKASVEFRPWKTCSKHASLTSEEVRTFIFNWLNSHTTIAIILTSRNRLKAASKDRQKSYVNKRRKPLEFNEEEHVEILEREIKKLKQSRITIVKVRWNSKRDPEFTWEREHQMKLKYPHLFSSSTVEF